jgi:hypothetical protein
MTMGPLNDSATRRSARGARGPIRAAVALALLGAASSLVGAAGDGLDPAALLKPLADSWPSYSGDYTGRRYSALTQIMYSLALY